MAAAGGTVTVEVPAVPTTLNADTVAGQDPITQAVASAIWPQSFVVNPQLQPALDTDLLQSAQVVGVTPLTVVYQIDAAAVWSDGVPITASDYVADWKAHVAPAAATGGLSAPASAIGYRDIASVTGSGEGRTVTVVFKTPFADWSSLFENLLPAHVVARVGWGTGFDTYDPQALVSGGPWEVASWQPGRQLVLDHNPRWWGTAPRLSRIVLRVAPGSTIDVGALDADLAQVASGPVAGPQALAAASSSPRLHSQVWTGTTVLHLEFNLRRTPLDETVVRQAIAHAVDRTSLVDTVVDAVDPGVPVAGSFLLASDQPGYSDDGATYEGKVSDATVARLLASAGLTESADGSWGESGTPVDLHLVWASDDPWSAAVAPIVAAQLVQAGFDVDSTPVTMAQLTSTVLPGGQFDLALVPVQTSVYPSQMERVFTTVDGAGGVGGGLDWMGYGSAHVAALFAQASQQLNGATEQADFHQLDQLLWQDLPSLPLFVEPELTVSAAGLDDVHPVADGGDVLAGAAAWTYLAPGRRGEPPVTTTTTTAGGS